MWAFCLIAVKTATWVTSSSNGAIWENSAKVLSLAGSAQTGTVWSGNTASIWATSTWRTLALLNQTNWSSLDRSFSTSTLCGNNISSLHRKWKFKNYPPPKKIHEWFGCTDKRGLSVTWGYIPGCWRGIPEWAKVLGERILLPIWGDIHWHLRASLVAQLVKNQPAVQETWVRSLGWEDPLEEG